MLRYSVFIKDTISCKKFIISNSNVVSLRVSRRAAPISRTTSLSHQQVQARFTSTTINSETISNITAKEKEITGSDEPVKGGPTAQAQKHVNESLSSQAISDITKGEGKITGQDQPIPDGPTSAAQSMATNSVLNNAARSASKNSWRGGPEAGDAVLDAYTISRITDAEKKLTGEDSAVKGGPTAQAQKHAGEKITSEVLSDITKAEKNVGSGERVRGGPTSVAQSELGKSRN